MASTAITILAAGASSRYGSPKQLLPWRGRSLLEHACDTALACVCDPVLVVLGAQADELRPTIAALPVSIVENTGWEEGLAASIRVGISALADWNDITAVVLMLCDQPLVTPQVIDELVQQHHATGKAIVAAQYDGTLGVPALFDADLFPALAALRGHQGAKQLFEEYPDSVEPVAFEDGAIDIDTVEDYLRLSAAEP